MVRNLTRRENEILYLVAKGLSNKDIAQQIKVEVSTVKVHMNNILSKLGIKNRGQLIVYYYTEIQKNSNGHL